MAAETKTLSITNFRGMLTDYFFGDINSGRSWIQSSGGANPFLKPGQLTWSEAPTLIDPDGSVITDLILCGKERVESGILYVYAVGHTGRVYKIQVNDPNTYNPDYDNPVLLATLTLNSPTFTRGGFIEFYGSTERMYISHDKGVTQLDFTGLNETFVGSVGSWTQNVPKPLQLFLGNLYAGNGSNIAEINSGLIVANYTRLSPGFPSNTQVRDIKLSVDGNYMQMVCSRLPLFDITSSSQQTTSTADLESYVFSWNGTDNGYTTSKTYPAFSLDAMCLSQNRQQVFGRDFWGTAVFDPDDKIQALPETSYISPNAVRSFGSMIAYLAPLIFDGLVEADMYVWGNYDYEVGNPLGFWDIMFLNSTAPETDINIVPFMLPISNNGFGPVSNGYSSGLFGTSKIYFSTLETSDTPTTKYRFYKWNAQNSLNIPVSTKAQTNTIYATQVQMFQKRIAVSEVRVYGEPWVDGNGFTIDLIGPDGNAIDGSSRTFTAGTSDGNGLMKIGKDYVWYNPNSKQVYALGIQLSNTGTTNHVINKIEIDYSEAGK